MNSISLNELKQTVADWMESSVAERMSIPSCVPLSYEAERRFPHPSEDISDVEYF